MFTRVCVTVAYLYDLREMRFTHACVTLAYLYDL